MDCAYFCERAEGRPEFAWCSHFRIYLDRAKRMCARCGNDKEFKKRLIQQYQFRYSPECSRKGMFCEIFRIPTNDEQCRMCKEDGLFRSFLHGQGQAAKNADRGNCKHKGNVIRKEERSCCGGKGNRLVDIFVCAKTGEVHAGICAECSNYADE